MRGWTGEKEGLSAEVKGQDGKRMRCGLVSVR